jgi:DNA-binding response OmpR family regulator
VPAPSTPRHLLVIDDEPHIGLLLGPRLEELGYRVSLARSLGTARAALAAHSGTVDALLLDLHLPDGSGLEFLRELRGAAATRALPVMVLTGDGDDHVVAAARGLDALLITKPFSPTKLTARIATMLAGAPGAPPEDL